MINTYPLNLANGLMYLAKARKYFEIEKKENEITNEYNILDKKRCYKQIVIYSHAFYFYNA